MAKIREGRSVSSPRSVGETYDGVRILAPKSRPKHFTTAQVRAVIEDVVGELHVEQKPDGSFALRRERVGQSRDRAGKKA